MSQSYNNTKLWLEENKFELLSSIESYTHDKVFDFKCIQGHTTTLTITAFRCRKSRAKRDNKELWLCDECRPQPRVAKIDYVNLGERKFTNYCAWLEQMKFKIKSTFKEFEDNKIAFECLQGHTTTITVKYFGVRKFNKMVINDPRLLCGHCNVKGEILADKLEQLQISVNKKTNHKILTIERGRKVTYICGNCGEKSETSIPNLTSKGPQYCNNCSRDNYNQTCFNRKPFVFPSGRIDNVLGHEPWCLEELIKHYKEEDIITDTKVIPKFYYDKISKTTGDEYKGRYYPDIMLPDKIIEVKSEFTFNFDKQNNLRKMEAVTQSGYNFEFWIYNNKKQLRVIRKDKY